MSVGSLLWTQPSGGYERQYSQSKIREGTGRFYQGQIAAPQRRIGSQVISAVLDALVHHAVFLGIGLRGLWAYEGRKDGAVSAGFSRRPTIAAGSERPGRF